MPLKVRPGHNLKSIWTDLYQKFTFDYVVEIEKKQEGAEGTVGWRITRFWIGKWQSVLITESIKEGHPVSSSFPLETGAVSTLHQRNVSLQQEQTCKCLQCWEQVMEED